MRVAGVTRRLGISEQTFYRWKKKFGGLAPSEVRRLKQLEDENRRLKQRVADLSLDRHMLQEVIRKSFKACAHEGAGALDDGVFWGECQAGL